MGKRNRTRRSAGVHAPEILIVGALYLLAIVPSSTLTFLDGTGKSRLGRSVANRLHIFRGRYRQMMDARLRRTRSD